MFHFLKSHKIKTAVLIYQSLRVVKINGLNNSHKQMWVSLADVCIRAWITNYYPQQSIGVITYSCHGFLHLAVVFSYPASQSLCLIFFAFLIILTSQWPQWRLKSPASRLFTQSFIQAQIKENIKAPRHWPLCGEFTGAGKFPAQRTSNAENGFIWWRHHAGSWNPGFFLTARRTTLTAQEMHAPKKV